MSSSSDGGMSGLPPGVDISLFLDLEYFRLATSYALTACWAGLAWDYSLCFPTEYKYFWKRRFTYGTLLYFMNRYFIIFNLTMSTLGVLVAPNDSFCAAWLGHLAGTGAFLQIMFAEAALLRRVLAIFGSRHHRLKYLLIATFLAANVSGLVVTQLALNSLTTTTRTLFGNRMCGFLSATPGPAYEVGFDFVPMVVFNVVLAGVSIHAFTREIDRSPFRQSTVMRLISAMRWQSVAHFVVILYISVMISLLGHYSPASVTMATPMNMTVASLISSRMLIFMQEEAHHIHEDDVELEITSDVIRDRLPATPRGSAERSTLPKVHRIGTLNNVHVGK
ncbi:hypothetical protein DL96DRAFT_1623076 [Flagelloscypha sp. PMI_526]|nr:hypothetical protein DL96DRAFT_1623076 [Flagelloscypha sp. PMI_526]